MRILIFLLFLPFLGLSQTINYQGNVNSISGFRGGLLVDLDYYFPQLKTIGTDTSLVGVDASDRGKSFKVTKSMIQRWSAVNSNLTFQQVLNNGSTFNKDNEVDFASFKLRLYGGKTEMDSAQTGSLEVTNLAYYNAHTWDQYTEYSIPDVGYVENLITQNSFDTTITETLTSLSSPRFANGVRFIVHPSGVTYNSDWWDLAGTTITFKYGLTLHEGQTIHIQL